MKQCIAIVAAVGAGATIKGGEGSIKTCRVVAPVMIC
jgi:hypothetical protein